MAEEPLPAPKRRVVNGSITAPAIVSAATALVVAGVISVGPVVRLGSTLGAFDERFMALSNRVDTVEALDEALKVAELLGRLDERISILERETGRRILPQARAEIDVLKRDMTQVQRDIAGLIQGTIGERYKRSDADRDLTAVRQRLTQLGERVSRLERANSAPLRGPTR